MKRRKKSARSTSPGKQTGETYTNKPLRVVAGGAAAAPAPAAAASAPPPGPELVEYEENEQRKIAARTRMIDDHRGQRSDLQARQAREVAELVDRHLEEERALDRAQAVDLAKLWQREGRPLSGWQLRVLGEAS